MLIKTTYKERLDKGRKKKYIKMQFLSAFLDITKIGNSGEKRPILDRVKEQTITFLRDNNLHDACKILKAIT